MKTIKCTLPSVIGFHRKNGGAHMSRIRGVKVGDDHLMKLVFVELSNITAFDGILLIKFKVNKLEIPRR